MLQLSFPFNPFLLPVPLGLLDSNARRADGKAFVVEIDSQHDGGLALLVHIIASEIEDCSENSFHTFYCF